MCQSAPNITVQLPGIVALIIFRCSGENVLWATTSCNEDDRFIAASRLCTHRQRTQLSGLTSHIGSTEHEHCEQSEMCKLTNLGGKLERMLSMVDGPSEVDKFKCSRPIGRT
eukprot:gnl/MRDRNA2_/MRDRNA2_377338_c0_seq1.p2 gnl/MRDRNA2_/MRDRNA2_377338_c0~~gnl/MRDRNA2_/MRDRNA2_377338_c0_seq1.p2  ORF type:complete len:112 (-),score=11.49 gnl/MRDRNA2_/MRDRNA2_377338_c0_seq1:22-357(-)